MSGHNVYIQYFEEGKSLLKTGNCDQALVALRKSITLKPGFLDAYYTLSKTYLAMGRDRDAWTLMNKLERKLGFDYDMKMELADVSTKIGEVKSALSLLNQCAKRYPDRSDIVIKTAELYKSLDQFTKAIRTLKKFSRRFPSHAEIYNQLGSIFLAKGQSEKAEGYFSRCLELDPTHRLAKQGVNKIMQTDTVPAVDEDGTTSAAPNLVVAKPERTVAEKLEDVSRLIDDENYGTAVEDLNHIIKHEPENIEALFYLGLVYKNQRSLELAAEQFIALLSYEPDHLPANLQLGQIYNLQGKYDNALATLKRILAEDPDYMEAHHELGVTYQGLDRMEEGLSHFKKAIELGDNSLEVFIKISSYYMHTTDYGRARNYLEQAKADYPEEKQVDLKLGELCMLQQNYADAEQFFRDGAEAADNFQAVIKKIAHCQQNQGKLEDSMASWEQAFELNPEDEECIEYVQLIQVEIQKRG